MVFLILKAVGALYFRCGIDEGAQWVGRQRMVIAAGVHIVELAGFVVATLGICALEEEALNFVGGVERIAFFLVHVISELFEQAADIGGVWLAAFVDYVAEDQDFARAQNIRRAPIKSTPIHWQSKVAFTLRGKATDGRSVKGEIVPALDEELFVIVQHVQAAFKVTEENRN